MSILLPRLGTTLLALTVLVSGQTQPALGAEGRVLRARMTLELPREGHFALVTIRYELQVDPTVHEIPLRAIAFFGAELTDVTARVGDLFVPVEFDRSPPPIIAARVRLLNRVRRDSLLTLTLSYALDRLNEKDVERFDVTAPLLLVDLGTTEASEGMFAAELRAPAEYTVLESFPTVPRSVLDLGSTKRYVLTLQAIPSMVRWRGTRGPASFFTFGRVINLVTGCTILALLTFGYRRLRRE